MKNNLFLFVSLTVINLAVAQDCIDKLEDARRAYYNGDVLTVTALLVPCIENEVYSNSNLEVALQLAIKSHLIQGNDSIADSYMLELLQLTPLLRTAKGDIIEYKKLKDSYDIRPKTSLGVYVGTSYSIFSIMQYRSLGAISQENDDFNVTLQPSFGFHYQRYFTDKLFLSADLLYQSHQYRRDEGLLGYQRSFIEERLTYISIPIQAGVEFKLANAEIYISGGISPSYLIFSRADLELFSLPSDGDITISSGVPKKVEGYSIRQQRQQVLLSYTAGAGFRRQFGKYGIGITMQYEFGINNLSNAENRYRNEELWEEYSYVSDDFKVDAVRFLFSLSRKFYFPQKDETE